MSNPTTISGMLDAKGLKIAILATRFNDFIVDRLTGGALDYLERHGLDAKNITIVRIPGAFEMPLVCQKLAASGKYDGIVALGAVIRGATPHFDYVCNEASKGIAQVMLQYKTPIGFGLLTCDSIEQAIERIHTTAAPLNAIRHPHLHTPCQTTKTCMNCQSADRLCNTWSITEKSFPPKRIKIILINEPLGL